jgi:ABC-type Na+ efflux pump permease subunit
MRSIFGLPPLSKMSSRTLANADLIARHDFKLFLTNKRLLSSTGVGYVLITLTMLANIKHESGPAVTGRFIAALLALSVLVPITTAVHSIVGEKERGTIEPLLLLPVSTEAIILGKGLLAWILSVSVYVLAWLLAITVVASMAPRNFPYILNPITLFVTFVVGPITTVLFTLFGISVSARAPDTQTALGMAQLIVAPAGFFLIAIWLGAVSVTGQFLPFLILVVAAVGVVSVRGAIRSIDPERLVRKRGR